MGVFLEFLGSNNSSLHFASMICGVIGLRLLILGVVISLVTWVVEGFLLGPDTTPQ